MSTPGSSIPSGSEPVFQPDPPKKPTFGQVFLLFVYHIVLAITLAYAIYNVWPPQPWPGDEPPANTNSNNSTANSNTNANTTAGTTTGTPPSSNTTAGTVANGNNGNARPVANGNGNGNTNTTAAATNINASGGPGGSSGAVANANNSNSKEKEEKAKDELGYPRSFSLFWMTFRPPIETRLILLVLLAGAIGSYVHAASSFVDYLGNRTIISSWVWWYLLRPFIGMMLALIFYFVFRGGFITAGTSPTSAPAAQFINPFGIAALAALVGMFSKVATDKLNEVFTTLFRPAPGQGDAKRGDKLGPPTIGTVTPNRGAAAGGTAVTITGTGFVVGAHVTFGGVPAPSATVASPTTLNAVTPPHPAGPVNVEVTNPDGQKVPLNNGYTYE